MKHKLIEDFAFGKFHFVSDLMTHTVDGDMGILIWYPTLQE